MDTESRTARERGPRRGLGRGGATGRSRFGGDLGGCIAGEGAPDASSSLRRALATSLRNLHSGPDADVIFMASSSPPPTYRPLAIVSRYEAFPAVMVQLGYAPEGTPYFSRPHVEDVRGFHILCDTVDLVIAAHATGVSIVPISLPPDVDSHQAPSALLRKYVGALETYVVRGSSSAFAAEYNGGTTSASTEAARSLVAEFSLGGVDEAELAEKLDQLFWQERRAGEESEKMYLRLVAAERDRRVAAENQLLLRPALGKAPTSAAPIAPA